MILTYTPNPALDLTWQVDALVAGASHRVEAGTARAGGKGLNVARVLYGQRIPVLALAAVGGGTGAEFAAELRDSGMPHRLVPTPVETRRSIAIVDRGSGEATLLNERGTPLDVATRNALRGSFTEELARAQAAVISGSLPPGMPPGYLGQLVVRAREAGVPVIVDVSGPALIEAAGAGAALLKPNLEEAAEATGSADPARAAATLLAAGAQAVVVSLGADGMLYADGSGRVLRARVGVRLTGNATGAGDAAVAAFAAGLVEGRTVPETLPTAVAWSAAAVLMPQAGDISPRWVEFAASAVVTESGDRP